MGYSAINQITQNTAPRGIFYNCSNHLLQNWWQSFVVFLPPNVERIHFQRLFAERNADDLSYRQKDWSSLVGRISFLDFCFSPPQSLGLKKITSLLKMFWNQLLMIERLLNPDRFSTWHLFYDNNSNNILTFINDNNSSNNNNISFSVSLVRYLARLFSAKRPRRLIHR